MEICRYFLGRLSDKSRYQTVIIITLWIRISILDAGRLSLDFLNAVGTGRQPLKTVLLPG